VTRRNGEPGTRAARGRGRVAIPAARLMAEAERARENAYAPYSRFRVGAALLTRDGEIVHGCNVENASLGLTICAERNAIWKAVSAGTREFVAIAVTADRAADASPCGACRQVLHEFAPDAVVLWRENGRIVRRPLARLLERPFRLAQRKPR
jgi:cytidine deaminase